jgi:hypothetical protein
VVKSIIMSWVGHVACKGEMRLACRVFFGGGGDLRGRDRLKDVGINESDIKMDLQELGLEA